MRILTVTHFYESHGGGIERVAGHLCRHLAAAGNSCAWVASDADAPPDTHRVDAIPFACINPTERLTGLPMPVPGLKGLRALARAIDRADGVIVHDALYVSSIAALILARVKRKPVLLIQHIAEIPFAAPILRGVMALATAIVTRPMLRAADQVVFISDTVRAHFRAVRVRRPAKLLFNGVDTSIFHARHAPVAPHRKLAAFIGRFVPKKGLDVVRELARLRPDIGFALAGAGPIDPTHWGLANITVLGPLPQADVADLLRRADVLLLPSVGEGYPLVIQEALACGTPVICGAESARADPGAGQWLRGVDINLSSPRATAAAISQLLDAPEPDAESRNAMADYAAATYSWPAMAGAIEIQFRELLELRTAGTTVQPESAAAL